MPSAPPSIVEAIAKLSVNLTRIIPVKSAESQTVVQLHAAVGHVQRSHRNSVFLSEGLAESNIERGMAGQIIPRILHAGESVGEPRAVVHIRRGIALPGQAGVEAQVQGVSLIVVDR